MRTFLFTVVAVVLIFAAAEGVLRAMDLGINWGDELRRNRLFYANFTKDGGTFDEHIVLGAKVYPPAPGNYRVDKEPEPKQPGEVLILCLGDSCTWGVEVDADKVYCALTADILREQFPDRKIRSVNLGRPGYTSFQGKELFERVGPELKPDFVTFHFGPNDGSDAPIRSDVEWDAVPLWALKLHRDLYEHLRIYRIYCNMNTDFLRWRVKHPTKDGLDTPYRPRVTQDEFFENLRTIKTEAGNWGGQVLVIPSVGFNFGEVFRNPYFLNYEPEPTDVPAYRLFRQAQKQENRFLDSVHPNESGHRLLAEALAGIIADRLNAENSEKAKEAG
ncbi:SGNH/GDSL hydrolase family protein [bacterium]|nr:SGNH/GDSL hydrolase family protein [bacterium]